MELWEMAGNIIRSDDVNGLVREVYGPGALLAEPHVERSGVGYRVVQHGWSRDEDVVLDTATWLAG